MRSEMVAQRQMYQVGSAVVPLDVAPARRIYHGIDTGRLELVVEAPADHRTFRGILSNGIDFQFPAAASDRPRVAHLPTRLGVERILLQHQLDSVAVLPE